MVTHKLTNGVWYNGDCLEAIKNVADGSVDMVMCDLPYATTENEWDALIPFEPMWRELNRVTKETGAMVMTSQTPFSEQLGHSNLKNLRYKWTWVKSKPTGHLNANKMPMKSTEDVLVFYRKLPTYNPQGIVKKHVQTLRKGDRVRSTNYGKHDVDYMQSYEGYPKDVLNFGSVAETIHPTQKPVELFEYLIRTYSNEGETVLDLTAGSGTTAVAAEQSKRKWICMEMSEDYTKGALDRIEASVAIQSHPAIDFG